MENLLIAVDPGFDSMKVVANGNAFKFPFNVVETDERKMSDYRLREDFMLYQNNVGTTFRVGQYARELVYDNKSKVDNFYTEDRFTTDEFQVGIDTAIALAIEKNGLYTNQKNLNIHIMVALPHACRSKFASTVIGATAGTHRFSLRCGQEQTKSYQFQVQKENVHTISQTIAAILGETSDDNGNINEEKFFYLNQGPTLVLDGGYYTTGMVVVSRGGSIDDARTESNKTYAMANVNQKVADAIKDKRPDINHYAVEYLLNKDNGELRYLNNGKAAVINLPELRNQMEKEVCNALIAYLNSKYNNLLDFKYVLVTGGTGARFYQHMLRYYSNTNLMDADHLMLTTGLLEGTMHPIEYAIAIGSYKGLKGTTQQ